MVRTTAIAVVGMMVLATSALPAAAAETASTESQKELAHAIVGAWLPLESGMAVSAGEGTPLSAKYEIDDGAFQLSVYTWKSDTFSGDSFVEVIVDFNTGVVAKVSAITDGEDLTAAQSQKAAMAQAKRSLGEATAAAVGANSGYRAVSAMPGLNNGSPVAAVTLVRGDEWKIVTVPLN